MNEAEKKAKALDLFEEAYRSQMQGDLEEAINLYRTSIDTYPTAEAHTFLGWTYSFLESYDLAIEECRKATSVDPAFGNPYNDVGVYLIEMGQEDEAIPFLRKALAAKRYEARHFPHYNLGRIWMKKGMLKEAIAEFHKALEIEPDYTLAYNTLRQLEAKLN